MTGITEITGSRVTMTRLDASGQPTGEVQDFSALTSVIEFDATLLDATLLDATLLDTTVSTCVQRANDMSMKEVDRPLLSQPYYRHPAPYTQEVTFFRPEAELMAILLGMSVVDTSLMVDTHIERGTN